MPYLANVSRWQRVWASDMIRSELTARQDAQGDR